MYAIVTFPVLPGILLLPYLLPKAKRNYCNHRPNWSTHGILFISSTITDTKEGYLLFNLYSMGISCVSEHIPISRDSHNFQLPREKPFSKANEIGRNKSFHAPDPSRC